MGRKDTLVNYAMYGTGGDMSQATATSNVTDVRYTDNIGIVVSWTGTSPIGLLACQVSNDQTTWTPLNFGSNINITGNTGTIDLSINQLPFAYIRLVYTKTSGLGTILASLTQKQAGG